MAKPTLEAPRKVYCVLSANSLPYARLALETLTTNCLESLDLKLVTDGASDAAAITEAMQQLQPNARHRWSVHAQAEADDLAATAFAGLPHLQAFRFGHPCWRKITDPLLLAEPDEEMVILDPDLYFPNTFRFEPTPASGILLMWQAPICLLPDETVMTAYRAGVALANHVDIGVGHARRNLDLDWLNWLVGQLGGTALPRMMHIEAIVWAAIAMREGGGYLNPTHWHCWRATHLKRLLKRLGVPGTQLLRADPFGSIKCFHGGGPAKWWVPTYQNLGRIPAPHPITESAAIRPFVSLTLSQYEHSQRLKRIARKLGYHRLLQG